jgi:ABC-type glycerol-3-phosphate transport system substrate-binding protein
LGIPASARDPDASFQFIQWATSPETITKIALDDPFPDFVLASVAKNPAVIKKYAAIQPDFLDLRVAALAMANPDYRPLIPSWPEIGEAIGDNVNAALTGVKSPRDALKAAQNEMKSIMGT